jgi:uncharacterized protein (TIGR02270 family)
MPESRGQTPAFEDLIEESLDEATFLWGRWETELTSFSRNLDEVWSWTEDRLLGALDGASISGSRFVDIVSPGLASDEPPRVTVSAAILGRSEDPAAIDAVVAALKSSDEVSLPRLIRGLEVMGSTAALRAAAPVLRERGALAELCRLIAFRRAAMADDVRTGLAAKDAASMAAAMRAAMYDSTGQFDSVIASQLKHQDPDVHAAALEAGLRRGMPEAKTALVASAASRELVRPQHLTWLALSGNDDEFELVSSALRVPALQKAAIWALGHIGTPKAVELCLRGMAHEALARACGEAYAWITGADLSRDRLEKAETAPDAPPFEEDDLEANLVPDAADLWPMPDADAVREHWAARSSTFIADTRHIHGRPATPELVRSMIETGPMRRRPDLAFELAVRTRGRYDVEVRALTSRQRQMMAASGAAMSAAVER